MKGDPGNRYMATEMAAIDRSTLEAIRSLQSPSGDDLLSRIVRTFIDESARLLQLITEAIEHTDSEAVRASAHSLKSCSGNVGACQVAVLARELEMDARRGTLENADNALTELRAELARAVSELEILFDTA